MLLAGDIGGTKTSLGIYTIKKGPLEPLLDATFPSGRYLTLEALIAEFLAQTNTGIECASLGVAGPVVEGRVKVTNLPWVIDETTLAETLNLKCVCLLNDLEAIAQGLPLLGPGDIKTLNKGVPLPGGTLAVVAPGTGLGEAFLTWDGIRYRAHASEGGHVDFAPSNQVEIGLLTFLKKSYKHISYERICSGYGLTNIYRYLKETGYANEPGWLAEELNAADDPTPVIVNTALDTKKTCELCTATLTVFVSVLGAEAGNLALKVLATGGVYLGGGIPPRILSVLEKKYFMESFTGKGRFSELMARMPVHAILNPKIALIGAASHGLELLKEKHRI